MKALLIGLGEVGTAVYNYYDYDSLNKIITYDSADELPYPAIEDIDILLVCIPYSKSFIKNVNFYKTRYNIKSTIIFSSVPIGTTAKIDGAVHSPIEGVHPYLVNSLNLFERYVGGEVDANISYFFDHSHHYVTYLERSEITEFLKLQSTSNYGLMIEYARYINSICDKMNISYEHVKDYNRNYNELYEYLPRPNIKRYILDPPDKDGIKGHCILENAVILNELYPNNLLTSIMRLGKHESTISEGKLYLNKTWLMCEYYGKNRSTGDIARQFNVSQENISAIMKRRGIQLKNKEELK